MAEKKTQLDEIQDTIEKQGELLAKHVAPLPEEVRQLKADLSGLRAPAFAQGDRQEHPNPVIGMDCPG